MMRKLTSSLLLLICVPTIAYSQHVIERSDYASMAMLSARMGKTAEALLYFEKAIEKSPDDYSLYLNRSSAYLNMSQPKKALADLEKAKSLMKGKKLPPFMESGFLANEGEALSALNRNTEAIQSLKRSVELFPMNASSHVSLGKLYAKEGNKTEALKQLKIARKQYPAGYNLKFIDEEIADLEGKKKTIPSKQHSKTSSGASPKSANGKTEPKGSDAPVGKGEAKDID